MRHYPKIAPLSLWQGELRSSRTKNSGRQRGMHRQVAIFSLKSDFLGFESVPRVFRIYFFFAVTIFVFHIGFVFTFSILTNLPSNSWNSAQSFLCRNILINLFWHCFFFLDLSYQLESYFIRFRTYKHHPLEVFLSAKEIFGTAERYQIFNYFIHEIPIDQDACP